MIIRFAIEADFNFFVEHDVHVSSDEIMSIIQQKRILLIQEDDAIIGWLRWNLFWDNTPFMNMLVIIEEYRNQGYGKMLVDAWETCMKNSKYQFVMTSTLCNENAQHFYRKLHYIDAGSLLLKDEPLEIIFLKYLME